MSRIKIIHLDKNYLPRYKNIGTIFLVSSTVPARGFSDKNFRLCPSTDGRPYLLGFENFLTGVKGRGGKEDGKVPACACDHMCPQTPRTVPKRFICFFLVLRVVCADTCDRRRRDAH